MKSKIAVFFALLPFFAFSQSAKDFTLEMLLDSIEQVMKDQHIIGVTLGITTKDSIIFSGGLGYADLEEQRKMDNTSLVRMGSITKMFVSLGIMRLIEEGQLQLTDNLKDIAPEVPFNNRWEATYPIKIIHLLEQTTGFDDVKLNSMYDLSNQEKKGLESVLAQKSSLTTRWKPGERHAYSNPNYVILGYIIEKITGKSYTDYCSEAIFQPLGMRHSNLNVNSQIPEKETREYYFKKGKIVETEAVTLQSGAVGALWSTTDDMLRFLQFFLNDGDTLFTANQLNRMERHEESVAAKSGLDFGYGLANYQSFLYKKNSYNGHHGQMGNCQTSFFYNRDLDIGFVVANNSNVFNSRLESLIVDYLEQNIENQPLKTSKIDLKTVEPFLGYYEFANPRNQIGAFKDRLTNLQRLFIKDGQLFLKPLIGNAFELVQVGENTYAYPDGNGAGFALITNEEGQKVLIAYTGYYEKTSAFSAIFGRVMTVLAVLLVVSTFFIVLISLVGAFFNYVNWKDFGWRLLPSIGLVLLIWAVLKLLEAQTATFLLYKLATINAFSLTIFLGTASFGVITVVSSYFTFRHFKNIKNRAWAIYWALVHIGLLYVMFILLQNGWIGMRTWAM